MTNDGIISFDFPIESDASTLSYHFDEPEEKNYAERSRAIKDSGNDRGRSCRCFGKLTAVGKDEDIVTDEAIVSSVRRGVDVAFYLNSFV